MKFSRALDLHYLKKGRKVPLTLNGKILRFRPSRVVENQFGSVAVGELKTVAGRSAGFFSMSESVFNGEKAIVSTIRRSRREVYSLAMPLASSDTVPEDLNFLRDSVGQDEEMIHNDTPNNRQPAPQSLALNGAPNNEDGTRLDIAIFYTTDIKNQFGGIAALLAALNQGVEIFNTALQNSQVNGLTANLVLAQELPNYGTNLSTDQAHSQFRFIDGVIDETHAIRESVGADVAILYGNFGGGYNGLTSCPWITIRGLAAMSIYGLTFSHELAHCFGAGHLGDPPPYGAHSMLNGFSTILGSTNLIPYFSNPAVSYQGQATGTLLTRSGYLAFKDKALQVTKMMPRMNGQNSCNIETRGISEDNSSNVKGLLYANGSPSFGSQGFSLTLNTQMPLKSYGCYFGPAMTPSTPIGAIHVESPLTRVSFGVLDSFGKQTMSLPIRLDWVGQTLYFQCRYQDPLDTDGTGTATTNTLAITFCP